MPEPKICSICERKALYHAKGKGFCGVHRSEAVAATLSDKRRIMSETAVTAELSPRLSHKNRVGYTESMPWQGLDWKK